MKFPTVNWAQAWATIYGRKYLIAGVIVLLIVGGAVWRMVSSDSVAATENAPREVVVARVLDLMNGGTSLSVVGDVQSKNEAKISTEASGRITRVNVSLGDTVGTGTFLAEIENSSQRAAVLQAEGAYDAAKAAVPNLESSLESAKGAAVSTLLSAYANLESAIRDAADPLFTNPNSSALSFNIIVTTDSQAKLSVENTRGSFNTILNRHKMRSTSLSPKSDLAAEFDAAEADVRAARNFIDTLLKALNSGVPSTEVTEDELAAYKSEAASARTALTTSLSAITSARSALEVATNNAESNGNGGVSLAQASLKQAEGAYNAALANLEKTRIRAPISGTVTHFSLKLGDNVSPGQQVAIVSNTGTLEIIASVTEEDRSQLAVGAKVTIEGGYIGTVTRIAPALDPVTRMIEVRVGLTADVAKNLTNGESVRLNIEKKSANTAAGGSLRIPLAALKMGTERNVVFTVGEGFKLVAHEVKVGALSGDYITITEGLFPETEIVADARGLKEGDVVQKGSRD
ncbi:MAG: efflux RND transporter periplasmic adaptor subunit [Patescibacteria group bacterium]